MASASLDSKDDVEDMLASNGIRDIIQICRMTSYAGDRYFLVDLTHESDAAMLVEVFGRSRGSQGRMFKGQKVIVTKYNHGGSSNPAKKQNQRH